MMSRLLLLLLSPLVSSYTSYSPYLHHPPLDLGEQQDTKLHSIGQGVLEDANKDAEERENASVLDVILPKITCVGLVVAPVVFFIIVVSCRKPFHYQPVSVNPKEARTLLNV